MRIQARQAEACDHLAVIWDTDKDVPHPTRDLRSARYLEWTGMRPAEMAALLQGGGEDALERWSLGSTAEFVVCAVCWDLDIVDCS